MDNNREIFAPEIMSDGQYGDRFSFFERDLVSVENWKPKSNYEIPFFITTNGNHTAPTTLGEFSDGFPDFISLDSGNLVNLKNVSAHETADYGGKVFFGGSKTHTSVNKTNSVFLSDLIDAAKKRHDDQRFIIGTSKTSAGLYPAKDVCFFDMWRPKKNYHVPRFLSQNGYIAIILTFKQCKEAFPYLFPATPSHLINVSKIVGFDEQSYGSEIIFKDTDYTCPISKSKLDMLKKNLDFN
ncbi:LytTR family transcriptional regulator DNA-binding domain-containing protein [Paenibacillus peoriae]|uniref:LytTR family transcriptional regulator DNA-binding domain-containing protein n=1 Tax=Paenibacillus peoriae TaxID=59893 RepID=UPI00096CD243|nr:LytTR family transcriptional regulator DNA-binding domain-containing protein [Paenibacillus peoriae]OMF50908.1 hypothetical protein BK135_01195 [Paenibacillus peoriae]